MAQVKVNMQDFKNISVPYNLTRVEANILLDWVKGGITVPQEMINQSLVLTGDNAPYRCAEGYAQGLRQQTHTGLNLINHT